MVPPEESYRGSEAVGAAIYRYISTFNEILTQYFLQPGDRAAAQQQMERSYRSALEKGNLLI